MVTHPSEDEHTHTYTHTQEGPGEAVQRTTGTLPMAAHSQPDRETMGNSGWNPINQRGSEDERTTFASNSLVLPTLAHFLLLIS